MAEVGTLVKTWFGPLVPPSAKVTESFLPKLLSYYKQLGEKVFQFIEKQQQSTEDITTIVREKFAEFLCILTLR